MKILYVTALVETINAFLVPHIEMLIEKGNVVECACNINTELDKRLIARNINIYNIKFSRNPLSINYKEVINQLRELQEKNKYDIVHVHTPIAAFITRFALKEYNCKMIYTAHGFHFYEGAPITNWLLYYNLERIAARWTDVLVTINREDFERTKKFNLRNNGKVKFMHGVGIDISEVNILSDNEIVEYRKSLGLSKDDFVILILADINKNKNHIQIIKAMKILNKKYPNIKVICAGKGELLKNLEKIVKENMLCNNIKFIGFRKDVDELIQCSDCIGLFSIREGLGKCLLEGMSMNKPLIATDTRGPRELIDYDKNGYLVKLGDYEQTAYLIEKLYLNKDNLYKFGEYSKNKIEKYYLDNVLHEIEDFY